MEAMNTIEATQRTPSKLNVAQINAMLQNRFRKALLFAESDTELSWEDYESTILTQRTLPCMTDDAEDLELGPAPSGPAEEDAGTIGRRIVKKLDEVIDAVSDARRKYKKYEGVQKAKKDRNRERRRGGGIR